MIFLIKLIVGNYFFPLIWGTEGVLSFPESLVFKSLKFKWLPLSPEASKIQIVIR